MPDTAIVTGAASGIGLEAARDLLDRGWRVFGLDRVRPELPSPPGRFHPVTCDLRDAAAVRETLAGVAREAPAVNALICSAGALRIGALSDMPVEEFDLVFDVNVRGLWLSVKEALPLIRTAAAGGGLARIIILSSVSAIRPKIGNGAYAASKAAVSQLTQVLAVECAPEGILVNAIAPGTVDTPMVRTQGDRTRQGTWRPSGPSPLGRVAEPMDIVRVMRFLLSEDAAYVTGTVIPVDGGTRAAFVPPR